MLESIQAQGTKATQGAGKLGETGGGGRGGHHDVDHRS